MNIQVHKRYKIIQICVSKEELDKGFSTGEGGGGGAPHEKGKALATRLLHLLSNFL